MGGENGSGSRLSLRGGKKTQNLPHLAKDGVHLAKGERLIAIDNLGMQGCKLPQYFGGFRHLLLELGEELPGRLALRTGTSLLIGPGFPGQ